MRFLKSRDNSSTPKSSPAPGQGRKAVKPKYEFEFGDPSDEEDSDLDNSGLEREIARRMFLASLRSSGTKQQEHGPKSRRENEDPKANELFQNVPGYKKGLQPEGQTKRLIPFVRLPDSHVRGPASPTRRVEGEDPAADKLLAGASERQGLSQREESPAPLPVVNDESPIAKLAREMRDTRLSGRKREKGEDPTADELFKTSARP